MAMRRDSMGSSTAQGMKSEAKAALAASRSMRPISVERRKSPRRQSFVGRGCMVTVMLRELVLAAFDICQSTV